MIVSVSRRTDIPAFYSEWFFNRIKQGFVYVQNPMNINQISKIELSPKTVDCFVFWTKNPEPMLERLDELKDFNYYFQFTITGYGKDVEKGIKDKRRIIEVFKELSKRIGRDKVILRYDPILLSNKYTVDYHVTAFKKLCNQLKGYTDKCVISFVDLYKKTERNTRSLNLIEMSQESIEEIAKQFSQIAQQNEMVIETCSEAIDLRKYGIQKGKCIDDRLISKILGCKIDVSKDKTQREVCGCVKSADIGQYNTCRHHCAYCYANFNYETVEKNVLLHDVNSPMLIGSPSDNAKITVRDMKSVKCAREEAKQISLLDELM
jgi:hypothetical protein